MAELALHDAVHLKRLLGEVDELASPAFTGRRVVSPGHDRATARLADELERAGFAVDIQRFSSDTQILEVEHIDVRVDDMPLRARADYAEHARCPSFSATSGLVVLGDTRDVTDRWVAIPEQPDSLDALALELARAGAAGILLGRGLFDGFIAKRIHAAAALTLPILYVREDLLATLEGRSLTASATVCRLRVRGANVIGRLDGAETSLKCAPVLIGAHYDGVGDDPSVRLPGAGDNASGVACVLELARRLAAVATWPRPLLVSFFDAEEINALGSEALADELSAAGSRPTILNLDLAARFSGSVAVEARGAKRQLFEALDEAGRTTAIPLHITAVASDHRQFANAGFSAAGIALGAAAYHTPADTPAAVDAEALATATRLIDATARKLLAPEQGEDYEDGL